MKKSLMPKSRAKTAYGLLSDIARIALEEPKRMRMCIWGGVGAASYYHEQDRPACGTVGCIGGWTNALRPNVSAVTVLGLTDAQADELFYNDRLVIDEGQGTLPHAKRVAKHIALFQKKYAAQLKATRV